jgi:hypothetical protein
VNAGFVDGSSNSRKRVRTRPGLEATVTAPNAPAVTAMLYRCRQLHTGKITRTISSTARMPVREMVAAMPPAMIAALANAKRRRQRRRL